LINDASYKLFIKTYSNEIISVWQAFFSFFDKKNVFCKRIKKLFVFIYLHQKKKKREK